MPNETRRMLAAWKLSAVLMLVALATARGAAASATGISEVHSTNTTPQVQFAGTLRVLSPNPRYFTDDGTRAVYLTGSHNWVNLKDYGVNDPPSAFNYTAFLTFLQNHNHNFFRLWSWELPHSTLGARGEMWYRTPFPWLRTGPGTATDGKPKFDLTRLDDAYFARLYSRLNEAHSRGIYVAVMLWDGYGPQFNRSPSVDGFPYAGTNNINGINAGGTESQSLTNSAVTANQEIYLRRVVETLNGFDNVLYEIANEAGPYSTAWQYHMINLIKQIESTLPKQHPVGMTYQYSEGSVQALYDSPADWISTNEAFLTADGDKVIINDTDHSYGWMTLVDDTPAEHQAWVWKNFMRGCNTAFMDPYLITWPGRNAPSGNTPDPRWEPLRNALGRTRFYATRVDLASMDPSSVSSTGYCLANPGVEYLVYQPNSSASFTVNVAADTYAYEWYNPTSGVIATWGEITATGGNRTFTPPFGGDCVLYLKSTQVVSVPEMTPFELRSLRNPSTDGRLRMTFALPRGTPATLEALDINGRRVVAREVGSFGAGRHQIELRPEQRLSSGIYFVRLTQDGRVATARVTVLE